MNAAQTLKDRRSFLKVARAGGRWITPNFVLQALAAGENTISDEMVGAKFGYTVSRKVGNAVVRNRAKRRLREVTRLHIADAARAGWTYVLIARAVDKEAGFDKLVRDAKWAMKKLHAKMDEGQ